VNFKKARLAAGLTVQEVIKALKVSDAAVYMWETGQMTPKASRLREIADLYGCTIDELLREDE
jgi:transcriptional regulator with XRE-family HTH domain